MNVTEEKRVDSGWADKIPDVSPETLAAGFRKAEGLIREMDQIVIGAGMDGLGYRSQEEDIAKIGKWAGYLNNYLDSTLSEVEEQIDQPLYNHFNQGATEGLERITPGGYTTENTLRLTKYTTLESQGAAMGVYLEPEKLTLEDFLGLNSLGDGSEGLLGNVPKEFVVFTDMFAVDYTYHKYQNGKELTLEEYLIGFRDAGRFEHRMDQPVKELASAILDVTLVKPLIEACTGTDLITGENLTEYEKDMKLVSAVATLLTLGQGTVALQGATVLSAETAKNLGKALLLDMISSGTSYGVGEYCREKEIPASMTLIMEMAVRMGISYGGGKVLGLGSRNEKTISYTDYDDIYQRSHHNTGKDKVMLGKYDGGGETSYITRAGNDYEYFDLGKEWDVIKKQYDFTDEDMFKLFNEAFLDDGINNGKIFQFSHNPVNDQGALGSEFRYLLENNYMWDATTMTMFPVY